MIPSNPGTLGRGERRLQGKGALMSSAHFLLLRDVEFLGALGFHQEITSKQQGAGGAEAATPLSGILQL